MDIIKELSNYSNKKRVDAILEALIKRSKAVAVAYKNGKITKGEYKSRLSVIKNNKEKVLKSKYVDLKKLSEKKKKK